METLFEKLRDYAASGALPMHMPGHKRSPLTPCLKALGAELDVTEIDGFDDLHHPEGILKRAQEQAARLWGAEESYFMVNGSTGGILAALYAVAKKGEKVLVSRGGHKSVFHAIEVFGLVPRFLYPDLVPGQDFFASIPPQKVADALDRDPEIKAVLVVSPTYEGVISDIASIARVCHNRGVPLIVDEAHGAHLGFGGFPQGAVPAGADLTVQSLHKTLPALTQTAVLHRQGGLVDPVRLRHALSVFQTSSPSYLLMASIDSCVSLLTEKPEVIAKWRERLTGLDRELSGLSHIRPLLRDGLPESVFSYDPGKVLLSAPGLSGPGLARTLREKYSIELEMAAPRYVLAMTGPGDTDKSLSRFTQALRSLDTSLTESGAPEKTAPSLLADLPEMVMAPGEACGRDSVPIPAANCAGAVAGEYVWAYPPGIPLVVPGEKLTGDLARALEDPASGLRSTSGRLPGEVMVLKDLTAG